MLQCRVCLASVIVMGETIPNMNTGEEIKSVRAKYAPLNKAIKRFLRGTSRAVIFVRLVVLEADEMIQMMQKMPPV